MEVTRALHYGGIVALAWLALDRHTASAAAAGVFAGAAAITWLALASRLVPDGFPVPDLEIAGGNARRLEYPFGYWNALGAWAAMTAAMAVAWAAHSGRLYFRMAAAAVIPIAGAVVYLTYSRGSVIAVAIGVLAAVLASERRWSAGLIALAGGVSTALVIVSIDDHVEIAEALGSAGAGSVMAVIGVAAALSASVVLSVAGLGMDRWRLGREITRPIVLASVVTLVVVATAALASGFVGDVWDRVGAESEVTGTAPATDPADPDTSQRLTGLESNRADVYESAIDAYSTEPLLGIGAGNFEFWWAKHPSTTEYIVDGHSLYIETLAELGPIGLGLIVLALAWLTLMVIASRAASHSTRRSGATAAAIGALAVFGFQAGIDWFWEYAGVAALAFGSAAIAACGRSGARRRENSSRQLRFGLVVLALAMVLVQLPTWVSVRAVRASEDAIGAGDLRLARDRAQRAISAETWAARPHIQMARVDAAAGRLPAAARELRKAIDREPTNWRHRAQLAGIEQARGRLAEADSARQAAFRLYRLPPAAVDFVTDEMRLLAAR